MGSCATTKPDVACSPNEIGKAELRLIRANFFTVTGQLGGFDPCNRSVRFRIPQIDSNPPLMISVHGGGGISDVLNSNEAFHRKVLQRWLSMPTQCKELMDVIQDFGLCQ